MSKFALLYSGGGSQYLGMGSELLENYGFVRDLFRQAHQILEFDLEEACIRGNNANLADMNIAQPAIFTLSYAMHQVFYAKTKFKPDFACGHSLGEYVALACAGALTFEDGLFLVKKRGELLSEVGKDRGGLMIAVNKLEFNVVKTICDQICKEEVGVAYVAVRNTPKQFVISCTKECIESLQSQLSELGGDLRPLNIKTASHCPLTQQAAEKFLPYLNEVEFRNFDFPVISNVTGQPYTHSSDIVSMLIQHFTQPVKWLDSIDFMFNKNVRCFIEIGPQSILKNLLKYIDDSFYVYAYDDQEDVEKLFRNPEIKFRDIEKLLKFCLALIIATPNQCFIEDQYQKFVIEPYEKLCALRNRFKEKILSDQELIQTYDLVRLILKHKGMQLSHVEKNLEWLADNSNSYDYFTKTRDFIPK